jgi:hypothetical protein
VPVRVDRGGGELPHRPRRSLGRLGDGVLDVLDDEVLAEGVDEVPVTPDDAQAARAVAAREPSGDAGIVSNSTTSPMM